MDMLPCFVCGTDLPVEWDVDGPEPTRGVTLTSRGHSGSRFYESLGRDVLHIVICDTCLLNGRDGLQTYDEYEPVQCEDVVVGRVYLDRDPRPYDGQIDHSVRIVETDELGDVLDGAYRVDWFEAGMDQARSRRKARALAERGAEAREQASEQQPAEPAPPTKRTRLRPPRRRADRVAVSSAVPPTEPPPESPEPRSDAAVEAAIERALGVAPEISAEKAARIAALLTPYPAPDSLARATDLDERREERQRQRVAANGLTDEEVDTGDG
jgi:hypothetical protein